MPPYPIFKEKVTRLFTLIAETHQLALECKLPLMTATITGAGPIDVSVWANIPQPYTELPQLLHPMAKAFQDYADNHAPPTSKMLWQRPSDHQTATE